MKVYSIYRITNLVNSKVYIGYTERSVSTRWAEHQRLAKKGTSFRLYQAIRKYGVENFVCDIVYQSLDKSHALETETAYVNIYKSMSYRYGYNMMPGGYAPPMCGKTHTEESRAKMSTAKKGITLSVEHRRKISDRTRGRTLTPDHVRKVMQSRAGYKHSDATKAKISASAIGRVPPNKGTPMSEVSKRKMSESKKGIPLSDAHKDKLSNIRSRDWLVTHPDGLVETIKSMNKFCIANGLNGAKMTEVAQGKRKHHKGFLCIMLPAASPST